MAWIVRAVKIGAEGEGPATDVMEIKRLGDLADIANLGLTLAETKRLLAGLQQEIVAAQVRDHAVRRPACSRCGGSCRVKVYHNHVVAWLTAYNGRMVPATEMVSDPASALPFRGRNCHFVTS